MFSYVYINAASYSKVRIEHIINGDLTIVSSGQYSTNGDDYDYHDTNTEEETVCFTGPLVNSLTVQVGSHKN